jgi:sodium-coupled neutral amino acid transporter 9
VIVIGSISCYSACLIDRVSQGQDFQVLVNTYLGRWWRLAADIASISILIGASIAYHILMSNSLLSFVLAFSPTDSFPYWDQRTTSFIILILMFPICCLRSLRILLRLSSFGVFSIVYIIVFVNVKSFVIGTENSNSSAGSVEVSQYKPQWYYLSGILVLAFFVHNTIISILRNNKYQHRNTRDVSIAFVLVAISLVAVGGSAYYKFGNSIEGQEDFLGFFSNQDPYAASARVALLLQLITVMPVIVFIIRTQIFDLYMDWLKRPSPRYIWIVVLNAAIFIPSSLFSAFYPKVATVLRFIGPACGLIYVFVLPIYIHLRQLRERKALKPVSLAVHIVLLAVGVAVFVAQFT